MELLGDPLDMGMGVPLGAGCPLEVRIIAGVRNDMTRGSGARETMYQVQMWRALGGLLT